MRVTAQDFWTFVWKWALGKWPLCSRWCLLKVPKINVCPLRKNNKLSSLTKFSSHRICPTVHHMCHTGLRVHSVLRSGHDWWSEIFTNFQEGRAHVQLPKNCLGRTRVDCHLISFPSALTCLPWLLMERCEGLLLCMYSEWKVWVHHALWAMLAYPKRISPFMQESGVPWVPSCIYDYCNYCYHILEQNNMQKNHFSIRSLLESVFLGGIFHSTDRSCLLFRHQFCSWFTQASGTELHLTLQNQRSFMGREILPELKEWWRM